MKLWQLIFLWVFLLCTKTFAIQLTVNAGNDTAFCGSIQGPYPRIGGNQPASGGVPPYTYEWTMLNYPSWTYTFLDSVTGANPAVIDISVSKVETFRLKVTDSNGDTATDDVNVFFPNWIKAGVCELSKDEKDTVTLSSIFYESYFHPLTFKWDDSTWLSDPTAPYPMCWVPVSKTFTVTITNSLGCFMVSQCTVKISPAAVPELTTAETISIYPNPVNDLSIIHIPKQLSGGILIIVKPDDQIVVQKTLFKETTRLSEIAAMSTGLHVYKFIKPGYPILSGKFVIY